MDSKTKKICAWVLRIAIFGTFLGHGLIAISIKPHWVPLITAYGFSPETALSIMPLIGYFDVLIAFVIIIYPIRLVVIWCIIWAFFAAISRPIAGEAFTEFIERTALWASPLAFLVLQGVPKKFKDLFTQHSRD